MVTVRCLLLVAATAATCTSMTAAAAAAVGTTSVDVPADETRLLYDADLGAGAAANQLTVAGTAPSATDGELVDILCTFAERWGEAGFVTVAQDVSVAAGSFRTKVPLQRLAGHTCHLRAVPAGVTGTTAADRKAASGPAVAVSRKQAKIVGGKRTGLIATIQGFWGSITTGDSVAGAPAEAHLIDTVFEPAPTLLAGASSLRPSAATALERGFASTAATRGRRRAPRPSTRRPPRTPASARPLSPRSRSTRRPVARA
jgi:hypothetical protein